MECLALPLALSIVRYKNWNELDLEYEVIIENLLTKLTVAANENEGSKSVKSHQKSPSLIVKLSYGKQGRTQEVDDSKLESIGRGLPSGNPLTVEPMVLETEQYRNYSRVLRLLEKYNLDYYNPSYKQVSYKYKNLQDSLSIAKNMMQWQSSKKHMEIPEIFTAKITEYISCHINDQSNHKRITTSPIYE